MFQFPANPFIGQVYTAGGISFRWNGTAWYLVGGANAPLSQEAGDLRYVQIANARSMESRIINGNFAIDQRGAGAALNINAAAGRIYGVDRWCGSVAGSGTITLLRSVDVAGSSYLQVAVGTAMTPAAGDAVFIAQMLEGVNISDMLFGKAQPQSFTFACRMACTVPGTYPISFRNSPPTHSYVKTVTLPAGAWTTVTMTIPGPTIGTWQSGNGIGLQVGVGLGVGSTFNAPTADTWQSGNYLSVAGCTNLMATAGAQLWITDARLYPGTVDYGPCRRLYADELRLCQRYYEKTYDVERVPGTAGSTIGRQYYGSVAASGPAQTVYPWVFRVEKRAVPTVTVYSPITGAAGVVDLTSGPAAGQGNAAGTTAVGILADAPAGNWSFSFHATASAEL